MNTSTGIRIALQVLGRHGFDGHTIQKTTLITAFSTILKQQHAELPNTKQVLHELKRQRLIEVTEDGQNITLRLSIAGMYRLQQVLIDNIKIEHPKRWDTKWRLVSFDVPLDKTKERVKFTKQLKRLGFIQLQKGLWIHPFECKQEVDTIASQLNIQRYYMYMSVNHIEKQHDLKLRHAFHL